MTEFDAREKRARRRRPRAVNRWRGTAAIALTLAGACLTAGCSLLPGYSSPSPDQPPSSPSGTGHDQTGAGAGGGQAGQSGAGQSGQENGQPGSDQRPSTGSSGGSAGTSGGTSGRTADQSSGQSSGGTSGQSSNGSSGQSSGHTSGSAKGTPTGSGQGSGSSGGSGTSSGTENETMQMVSYNGVQAEVPAGWTRTAIHGGDYAGWQYTNPKDPRQSVTLVYSSCVGCYLGQDGNPDPRLVIPQANASDVTLSSDGLTAQFRFVSKASPYPGVGKVTVSKDMAGYGYVEVVMPSSASTVADAILQSFSVHL